MSRFQTARRLDEILDLSAETLLKDVTGDGASGDVLSLRHRLFSSAYEIGDVCVAAVEIIRAIGAGRLTVVEDEEASIPTCVFCGCTSRFACFEGCSWGVPGCCSRCAEARFTLTDAGHKRLTAA